MTTVPHFPFLSPHHFLVPFAIAALFSIPTSSTATHPPDEGLLLTVVNNCPFTIWPAIQPNAGSALLADGGFCLPSLSHRSFPAPPGPWSGRIWARTGCTTAATHPNCNCLPIFSCATGDCGTGRVECGGSGGATPATLAQFSLHHGGGDRDLSSYGVSIVDGFNLPMTVTPHWGKGDCPVVGCKANLLSTCPECLRVVGPKGGAVVGCMSGCTAFGTDELCCRNGFNGADKCRPSAYSEFFKRACPDTFTYAHESGPAHDCSAPRELKVIFCH